MHPDNGVDDASVGETVTVGSDVRPSDAVGLGVDDAGSESLPQATKVSINNTIRTRTSFNGIRRSFTNRRWVKYNWSSQA